MYDLNDMFPWLLASFRATGLLMMLPVFVVRAVPVRLRLAIAALLAWTAVGQMDGLNLVPATVIELVMLVAKELSVGLLMGLAVRMVFFTLDVAAQILAVEIGLNASPEFDPSANMTGNPLAALLFYLGLVIYFSGAHYAVFFAFNRSFELAPPGLYAISNDFIGEAVRHSALQLQLGLLMAAPVMASNFLINLIFSVLGRVVPRMNVFVLSYPVRIMAGLGMLALSAGLIAHYIAQQLGEAPELMLHFLPLPARS